MAYIYYNPNPNGRHTDDCVIRAICKLTNKGWYYTYTQLSLRGFIIGDWGSCNEVWSSYLKRIGYIRKIIPNTCPDCYSVKDFCKEYPKGKYLLAMGNHTVTVIDGNYYDTWDSGNEVPIYYWTKD